MVRRFRPASGFGKPVPWADFLEKDQELAAEDARLLARGYQRPATVRPYLRRNGDITVTIRYRRRDGNVTFIRTQKLTIVGVFKR